MIMRDLWRHFPHFFYFLHCAKTEWITGKMTPLALRHDYVCKSCTKYFAVVFEFLWELPLSCQTNTVAWTEHKNCYIISFTRYLDINNLIEQLNVIPKTACGAVAIQIKVIYREIDNDLAIQTTFNYFGLFYNNIIWWWSIYWDENWMSKFTDVSHLADEKR